jgi:hypothetical protein
MFKQWNIIYVSFHHTLFHSILMLTYFVCNKSNKKKKNYSCIWKLGLIDVWKKYFNWHKSLIKNNWHNNKKNYFFSLKYIHYLILFSYYIFLISCERLQFFLPKSSNWVSLINDLLFFLSASFVIRNFDLKVYKWDDRIYIY